jgi:tripartite ATP-independent transporter DctM subunit
MVPGILLTLMFMLQIYLQCLYDPAQGPATAKTSLKEKLLAFKYAFPVIVLFSVVMGGIWFGVYTANEAGAIGCGLACLYAIYRKKVNKESLKKTFGSALRIVGIIFAIIVGAEIFSNFIVISGVSLAIAEWVGGLHLSPTGVVVVIMLIYFVLGTALDTLAMILVTLPFFVPVLNALHIDMVWFGILVVIQMELSQITPPVGLNLFVVAGMVKEKGISMGTVFSGAWPFCYTMIIYNALVVFFPQIAMYLPRLMK